MEVNQIIFFNLAIYLNILLSFFILFFALAITFIFIKDNFVRSVLSFGYICYLLPIFIIKDWQIDYYDHFFYLKIVSIFFIFVIIFYLILNSLFIKKNISNNYLKNIFIKENKNLLNLKKYIFFFFYLFTIFLLFYFFILKNSFFLIDDFLSIENLRFLIYDSSILVQLVYVLYLRFLSVIVILIAPNKRILFLFLIIELIAIQSLERQSVLIIMAAVFFRFILKKSFKNLFLFISSIFFVMLVVYFQRSTSITTLDLDEILQNFILLLVNRVILDPAQMLHLVYIKSQGLNFYLTNNRLIYLILSYFSEFQPIGYTAIGIIADGYKIFSNYLGVIFASFWFALIIRISLNIIKSCYNTVLKNIFTIILFFSVISFYYSNFLSIVPLTMIFILFVLKKIFLKN